MTHPVAMAKFVVLPLELGSFGLPVIFAWTITPADASTLVGALSILIAALFVGWVNVIAAKAAARAAVKPIAAKLDEITPLVTKIDAHVNSEKTKIEGEAVAYQKQIALQRETIEELKKATALLAQAKAMTDLVQVTVKAAGAHTAPVTEAAAPVLQEIEANTGETAANTQRQAAAVVEAVQEAKQQP